jgi:hypothetical protein
MPSAVISSRLESPSTTTVILKCRLSVLGLTRIFDKLRRFHESNLSTECKLNFIKQYSGSNDSPQSHRRNLQTKGKSTLRFQPIAKKSEIFLFFRLVHALLVITELQGIIPYDSDYKIQDRSASTKSIRFLSNTGPRSVNICIDSILAFMLKMLTRT